MPMTTHHTLVLINIDAVIKSLEEASEILFKWLLGVKFDHKLSFNDHISELCKKASRKIHALS